jgi:hypothetical protein
MTYAEAINLAIEGNLNDEAIERLNALKTQLAKRNSSGALKKPTKTQRENEEFKTKIVSLLTEEVDGMTATEIGSALAISCQKASALLSQMGEDKGDGTVRKVKEGKVTRFVLA